MSINLLPIKSGEPWGVNFKMLQRLSSAQGIELTVKTDIKHMIKMIIAENQIVVILWERNTAQSENAEDKLRIRALS